MQGTRQATMFMEFLAAKHDGNEKLANFYVERFPPDVRKAYDDGWRRSRLKIQTPIRTLLYRTLTNAFPEAAEATAKAASSLQASRYASSVSGQYLSNTVSFATVLFFASASGKFEQRRVRVVALLCVAVFLFAVVRITMLPLWKRCGINHKVTMSYKKYSDSEL